MFIRFVQSRLDSDSGRRAGILVVAHEFRDSLETPVYTSRRVTTLLAWFTDNLKVPPRFNRSRSKGAWRRNTTGLSWFKDTATEHLNKAHELCNILRDHGYAITILRTDRPGFIVYEDDHQIVAEPFADTPT
jgi:hypothetical protein